MTNWLWSAAAVAGLALVVRIGLWKWEVHRARARLLDRFDRFAARLAEAPTNPEALHAARRDSRRLREDVRLHRDGLEKKRARRLLADLARVGQTLGRIRERHAELQTLAELGPLVRDSKAAVAALQAEIEREIARFQQTLGGSGAQSDLLQRLRRDLGKIRPRTGAQLAACLRRRLTRRQSQLQQAVLAAASVSDSDALHAVRIAAKKLRYLAEAGVAEDFPGLRRDISLLSTLQGCLGMIQERAVLARRIDALDRQTTIDCGEIRRVVALQTDGLREQYAKLSAVVPEALTDAHSIGDTRADDVRVLAGASVPSHFTRPGAFVARFTLFPESERADVEAALTALQPGGRRLVWPKRMRLARGTEVIVRCTSDTLAVPDPERRLVWDATSEILDFDVSVPADAPDSCSLRFAAIVAGFPLLDMRIDLTPQRGGAPRRDVVTVAPLASTAFASYASPDRVRVLDRVAAVCISADVDVFLDCLSMRPNENWKARLAKEIPGREEFWLFWSSHAAASPHVKWEWELRLAECKESGLRVHPLEVPELAMPPAPLAHLQFNDPLMRVAEGTRRLPPRPTPGP